jgi:hypothetical protein
MVVTKFRSGFENVFLIDYHSDQKRVRFLRLIVQSPDAKYPFFILFNSESSNRIATNPMVLLSFLFVL